MGGIQNEFNEGVNTWRDAASEIQDQAIAFWEEEEKQIRARAALEHRVKMAYLEKKQQQERKITELIAKQAATTEEKEKKKLQAKINKEQKKQQQLETKEQEKQKRAADIRLHQERLKQLEDEAEYFGESFGNSMKQAIEKEKERVAKSGGFGKALLGDLAKAGANALNKGVEAATKGIDDAMRLFEGKASKINARLQGTSKTFNKLNDTFEKNLGASPFVKYQDSIENLATLVDMGIAYNVEQRAFLMTISDKIATTFDAHSSTLLKIIRIQQQDSTIYRMGAEAKLTEFFNSQFNDSSYMSDVYDQVSQAIASSIAQLGTAGGAEYEYNVQKWLGSLYSMGMSSDTLTNLASAVNMLSTGDVQGLSGSNLQNLLVMAAQRGGMSYGDLLSGGLSASNVDALLGNVVAYWGELTNTQNQVVRKQYADLFGLDMSDLVAMTNMNVDIFNAVKSNQMAYSTADQYLLSQMDQVASRMHISEMLNNVFDNIVTGIGTSVASNPFLASTYLINNLIKDATGGINIPFITAMGSGIGLETDLNSLVNLGIVGIGTLSQIGNVVSGIQNKGGLNLSAWGAYETNMVGGGALGVVSGSSFDTSNMTYIGNSSGKDIQESTLNAAYNDANNSTIAGQAQEEADEMKKAIVDNIDPNIKAILELLQQVSTGSALRVRVEDYGLTSSF